jgi:hypothetical protein
MAVTSMTTWSYWCSSINYCNHINVYHLAMAKLNLDFIVEFVGHDHFLYVMCRLQEDDVTMFCHG